MPSAEATAARLRRLGHSDSAVDSLMEIDAELYLSARDTQRGAFVRHILAGLTLEGVPVQIEPAQFRALAAVSGLTLRGEAATIGAVAQALDLDPSRASRVTGELVAQGYLRRVADQQDGRRSLLEGTEKAQRLLAAFVERKWQHHLAAFDGWSEDDLATFARLFARYRSKARALLELPPR